MGTLSQAIALAAEIHADQFDKGGEPYILHPLRVMQDAMAVEDGSHQVGIVAVLHDVLEDNEKYTKPQMRTIVANMFGKGGHHMIEDGYDTLDMLDLLTKNPGEDYLGRYIPRIIESGTWAITIKMADLRDNMNIRRQPTLDERAMLRIQKYHVAYKMLREAR